MNIFDVELDKPDKEGYLCDKDCYFGVDIFSDNADELTFLKGFSSVLNAGKGSIRIAQNNRLVLECMGEGQETRSFDLNQKMAKRLMIGFGQDYQRKICFVNSGYNALVVRFIKKKGTKQSILKQEGN